MPYIHFDHVNKYFGQNHVLKDISLEIEQGELVTFLGPSGCGKSTLLRCLSGLEAVTDGKIYLDGKDITDLEPKRRGVGMVFQQYSLFPNLTVGQNVAFGLKIQKKNKDEIQRRVQEMLEIVGLSEKINYYPRQLSGGQQQRVALARTLTQDPQIILADEPVAALDPVTARQVMQDFVRINKEMGISILLNIHHVELAIEYADRIIGIRAGRIVYDGPSKQVDQAVLNAIYGDDAETEATA